MNINYIFFTQAYCSSDDNSDQTHFLVCWRECFSSQSVIVLKYLCLCIQLSSPMANISYIMKERLTNNIETIFFKSFQAFTIRNVSSHIIPIHALNRRHLLFLCIYFLGTFFFKLKFSTLLCD